MVPSAIAGDLQLALGFAGVIGGEEMLPAVLDPLDRTAGEARGKRDEVILGIEFAARAEAAADVVLHHADRAFRQAHLRCQHAPVDKGDLGRAVDGQPTVLGVPLGKQPARLHRHGAVALDLELLAASVGCVLERDVGIAADAAQREREIATRALEQQNIGFRRRGAVDHGRQGDDIKHHRVERVLGRRRRFRQHDGDRLADIAHLVVGDDGLLERLERRRRVLPQRNRRNRRADIRRGDDGTHAGAGQRGALVDGAEAPVRERAAHDHGMQDVLAGQIIDVLPAPGQKREILDTFDRASDKGVGRALAIHVR